MKITRYITILAVSLIAAVGCQKEEMTIFDPTDVVSPKIAPVEDILINSKNINTGKVTFNWEKADFGIRSQVYYSIEAQLEDGKIIEVASGVTGKEVTLSYAAVNPKLVNNLGVAPGYPVKAKFYVAAKLNDSDKWYSEAVEAVVNTVPVETDRPFLYVVGQFSNWKFDNPQYLYDFAGNKTKFSAFLGFAGQAQDGFKVTGGVNWETLNKDKANFGQKDASATAESASLPLVGVDSKDIKCYSKNFYQFEVDTLAKTLKKNIGFDEAKLIVNGTATTPMEYASLKQMLYVDVTLAANSKVKVQLDNSVYGGEYDNLTAGGAEIVYPYAGNYRVYLDLNNWEKRTIMFDSAAYGEKEENTVVPGAGAVWGIITEADQWTSDAYQMPYVDSYYTAKGVVLAAGQAFKLRKNGSWDENVGIASSEEGDDVRMPVTVGAVTPVVSGGKNMYVEADGTYDVYLSADASKLIIVQDGGELPAQSSEWGVCGTHNNWGENQDTPMYEEGGYIVARGVVFSGTECMFKLRKNGNWSDDANIGLKVAGEVTPNGYFDVISEGGSGNFLLAEGTYDIWFDLRNMLVYVMETGKDPETAVEGKIKIPSPEETVWYLVGDFNGWSTGDENYKLVKESGYNILRNVSLSGKVKFCVKAGWSQNRGGKFTEVGKAVEVTHNGDDISVPSGTYDVYLSMPADKAWFMEPGQKPSNE